VERGLPRLIGTVRPPSGSDTPQPRLSVITPVYNVEPYLPECIESVLRQSLAPLEMLIVDDGSTDGTAAVIARYAAQDPRVRGFTGPNRGVSHARNVAMHHARGAYFALLDGDDAWEPTFAATFVGLLDRNPQVGIFTSNARNIGGPLDGRPVMSWPPEPQEVRFSDMIERVDAMCIMSVFRRSVYEAIGGFNESLMRSEDYEYWLRAAAAGFTVMTHPEPLGRYRRRPDSMMSNQRAMYEGMMRVLTLAREFRKRPRADELGAIDRQLSRLQTEYLLLMGKAALSRRDFADARSRFMELYRRNRKPMHLLTAAALQVAPSAVLAAYQARQRVIGRRAGS
jgi:glycosyltransferase involved in cell wall biosynthesis